MKNVIWTKSVYEKIPNYCAKVGLVELYCRPAMKYSTSGSVGRVIEWTCCIYFGDKFVVKTKTYRVRKHDRSDISLRLCQKNGEKLAMEHLFDYGYTILKVVKNVSILEKVLSEIGID